MMVTAPPQLEKFKRFNERVLNAKSAAETKQASEARQTSETKQASQHPSSTPLDSRAQSEDKTEAPKSTEDDHIRKDIGRNNLAASAALERERQASNTSSLAGTPSEDRDQKVEEKDIRAVPQDNNRREQKEEEKEQKTIDAALKIASTVSPAQS